MLHQGGPTSAHAHVYTTKAFWTTNLGIEKQMLERLFEAQNRSLDLRSCANLQTFCEEPNADSEDARRPFKNR
eukprot:692191-Heterocapsa_arctica.AAC.1